MFRLLVRTLQRVIILIPGIIVTFFGVKELFPALNKQLPATVAILLCYIIVAYFLIPAAVRIFNIFIYRKHIPLYCTTPDGLACDPVNVGVLATRRELIQLMKKAGWYEADKKTLRTGLRFIYSWVFNKPYPNAPFSSLFLFGRSQDIGFEIAAGNSPRHRHHVRFWGVVETKNPIHRKHAFFWLRHHQSPVKGRILWVGAASLDLGIGIVRHNAQITHRIHSDTNSEREFVVKSLKKTGLIAKTRKIEVGAPYKLQNRVLLNYMHADGKMTICELR